MPNARRFILYMARYYAKTAYKETGSNHQQFSDIVNRYGLAGHQSEPWCGTYQFALELMAFGKDQALKNWHMTAANYCGYSVFETEKKFLAAHATSKEPHQNDLVIFAKSHMGRVLSVDSKAGTFECAEGNSGDRCVVKTYRSDDPGIKSFCHVDYVNDKMTTDKLLGALKATYEMAHNLGWIYSNSGTIPPCVIDKRISCDRLEALACFILGYTTQPKGGFTVVNMERILTEFGWTKITDRSKLQGGDFVLFKQDGTTSPMWKWHAFALTYYDSDTNVGKYDLGSDERIRSKQPYTKVSFDQWEGKSFYCGFRAPLDGPLSGRYVIETAVDRDFVIDITGASETTGANVQIYKKNGTKAQTFILEYVRGDYYRIKNIKSNKVLDVRGAKVANKTNVWQYQVNGTNAQLWRPVRNADGSFTFFSALNKEYVLDLRGGIARNKQNIYIYKQNGTAAQRWFLVKK